jgi:hypothetical protein
LALRLASTMYGFGVLQEWQPETMPPPVDSTSPTIYKLRGRLSLPLSYSTISLGPVSTSCLSIAAYSPVFFYQTSHRSRTALQLILTFVLLAPQVLQITRQMTTFHVSSRSSSVYSRRRASLHVCACTRCHTEACRCSLRNLFCRSVVVVLPLHILTIFRFKINA